MLSHHCFLFLFQFGHSQQHSQSSYCPDLNQPIPAQPYSVHSEAIARTYRSSAFPKTTKKASNSSQKQQHPNRPVDAVQLHRTKPWESNPIRSDTHNRMYRNQKRQQSTALHRTLWPRQWLHYPCFFILHLTVVCFLFFHFYFLLLLFLPLIRLWTGTHPFHWRTRSYQGRVPRNRLLCPAWRRRERERARKGSGGRKCRRTGRIFRMVIVVLQGATQH